MMDDKFGELWDSVMARTENEDDATALMKLLDERMPPAVKRADDQGQALPLFATCACIPGKGARQ